jgi:hypothetical protein
MLLPSSIHLWDDLVGMEIPIFCAARTLPAISKDMASVIARGKKLRFIFITVSFDDLFG